MIATAGLTATSLAEPASAVVVAESSPAAVMLRPPAPVTVTLSGNSADVGRLSSERANEAPTPTPEFPDACPCTVAFELAMVVAADLLAAAIVTVPPLPPASDVKIWALVGRLRMLNAAAPATPTCDEPAPEFACARNVSVPSPFADMVALTVTLRCAEVGAMISAVLSALTTLSATAAPIPVCCFTVEASALARPSTSIVEVTLTSRPLVTLIEPGRVACAWVLMMSRASAAATPTLLSPPAPPLAFATCGAVAEAPNSWLANLVVSATWPSVVLGPLWPLTPLADATAFADTSATRSAATLTSSPAATARDGDASATSSSILSAMAAPIPTLEDFPALASARVSPVTSSITDNEKLPEIASGSPVPSVAVVVFSATSRARSGVMPTPPPSDPETAHVFACITSLAAIVRLPAPVTVTASGSAAELWFSRILSATDTPTPTASPPPEEPLAEALTEDVATACGFSNSCALISTLPCVVSVADVVSSAVLLRFAKFAANALATPTFEAPEPEIAVATVLLTCCPGAVGASARMARPALVTAAIDLGGRVGIGHVQRNGNADAHLR